MPTTNTRDEVEDRFRTVPLTCTDAARQEAATAAMLLAMEFHTTSDSFRAFIQNRIVNPVVHEAESEAEMLALDETDDRDCWRGDWCKRTDDPSNPVMWLCIHGRGTEIGDWFQMLGVSTPSLPTRQYVPTSGLDGEGRPTFFFTDAGGPLYVPKTFNP